jgi:hypothetical protein
MISLLDRIWGWVIMTFAAMALATANFHKAMAMAEHFGVGRGRHPEDFWTAESARWRLSCHLASSGSRGIGVSVDDRSESSNGISRRKQNRHSCVVEHSNRKQGVSNVRYNTKTSCSFRKPLQIGSCTDKAVRLAQCDNAGTGNNSPVLDTGQERVPNARYVNCAAY